MTRSRNGSTSVSHAIAQWDVYIVPTWVSLDSSATHLNLVTPDVVADTYFYFKIQTTVAGNTTVYEKYVYIKVLD